ncbi:molybdopterin adenylyltransferase [Salmonella enterica]|nr:molybdopterin adenylyltransferase [Salmonella enterica]
MDTLRIGLVSISDRASSGVYQDKGIPALEEWLASALTTPFEVQRRLIPDEQEIIEQTLCELVDEMSCHLVLTTPFEVQRRLIPDEQEIIEQTLCELVDEMSCHLVLTTGGTGPARRDVTPDATLAIADREMPGFGEQMRQISLRFVPTAILSRQVGVIRKQALILNLPGQPKSIKETLEGVKADDGSVSVPGIFASVPYCIQLLDGPYVETAPEVVAAFRPKSARRENMSD